MPFDARHGRMLSSHSTNGGDLRSQSRLVKGTGEIIERIVSRAEHRTINRMATLTDGMVYQASMIARSQLPP